MYSHEKVIKQECFQLSFEQRLWRCWSDVRRKTVPYPCRWLLREFSYCRL